MEKFDRKNQDGQMEAYIGTNGVIVECSETTFNNSKGTPYHRFSADVESPNGEMRVTGQIYAGLVPHLGGLPAVGAKMSFNASLADISAGINHHWNVGSSRAETLDQAKIDAILKSLA